MRAHPRQTQRKDCGFRCGIGEEVEDRVGEQAESQQQACRVDNVGGRPISGQQDGKNTKREKGRCAL